MFNGISEVFLKNNSKKILCSKIETAQ